MPKKEIKTNVMRLLDSKKVRYNSYTFASDGAVSGVEAARLLGKDPAQVFKTLVTVGQSKAHYVFVIPAAKELNLKKAAKAVGEKKIEMLAQKELLPLTGYIHGGCSPIGMKKGFPTTLDIAAQAQETILFSAGKIGYQVEMTPEALGEVISFSFADVAD